MNTPWIYYVALGAVLLIGAGLVWQRHRQHMAEIQRRLAWSEASRFELEQHAHTVDARLAEMSSALQTQQQALQSARELAERRSALDALLQSTAEPAVAATHWADTQPLPDVYADTQPGDVSAEPMHTR